ncbi:SusC/RagA family TonB-linked outer membrane protein [Chryseolinea lacunae]|uniref:SusC/RagA family TonB-linked outer membrane protein n=1 Tax=Chryseolinea lacunae TaxID=2801331 RepID=A0ABS1KKI2_9BACT|nr:SusC/RagA family TonB-linked outer membrane protein [Chryseolinea lacunae]MBL0739838.1 SusC/RagA family TonB-linked outer membrane protein [Chryseolinea lacunae]
MRKTITKLLMMTLALCLSMLSFQNAFAQITVSGKVTSEEKEGLPGVSVLVKGTSQGTTTDANGEFKLNVLSAESVLMFSFVGYLSEEITVGSQTNIDVMMMPDLVSLQEVVVIGYGTQRKAEVTTAVASVKEKEFTAGAMRDASELIKGKVAGLTITNGSGDPSAAPTISLRGIATLEGSATPLILINGVPGDFNTVSPSDITSIDVLKDASASAIYGTRGANGVILITTRNGDRAKAPTLTYSHYSALSTMARKADFLTASDYQKYAPEFTFRNGFVGEAEANGGVTDTDWLGEISRKAYMQNHNISLAGGGPASNYAASVNYINQDGVFQGSSNKELRISLDLNQYLFNDKLKLSANLLRGAQDIGALGDGASGSFNPLIYRNALVRNPMLGIQDANGKWIETDRLQYINPVGLVNETSGVITNNWTRLTSNITLEPTEGWQTNLMLATEIKNNYRGYYESKKHYNSVKGPRRNGFASRGDDQIKTNYLELTSKYSKVIDEHSFTALLGYSYQYNVNQGGWANNFDFPTDAYAYNNLGTGNAMRLGTARMGSYKNDNKLIGFFGRLNYGFGDRFNVLASVRREGSSKFGANNKWGTFPAVSAGWTLSNEGFLKGSSAVSFLKLRAGYGVTGVIPRDSYQSKPLLTYAGVSVLDDGKWINGLVAESNSNPDLKWETSREVNIGFDFAFFNDKVSGSIDGYVKKTKDLLWDYSVPQPPYLFGEMLANVGQMQNKGIEVLVKTTPVNSSGFEWNSTVTFSYNKNELTSLSNDLYQIEDDYISEYGISEPISMVSHRIEPGQPMGNFWGLKSVDITDDGLWVIELPDGTRQTMTSNSMATNDNSQILGNGIPKYRAGWINTLRYKGFDLSVVISGAFGYQIMNQQRMFYENPNINYNVLRSAMDNVYGKRRLGYLNQAFVSYYIENGDYVKVENATLGYNVNVAALKFIRSLRLYVSGSNLATITGYKGIDPEIARTDLRMQGIDNRDKFPTVRTYTIGVNVNF